MKKNNFLKFILKYHIVRIIVNIIAFIMIIILFKYKIITNNASKVFDFSIFSSFLAIALINIFSSILESIFENKIEDAEKLTTDYRNLINMYCLKTLDLSPSTKIKDTCEYNKLIHWTNNNEKQISFTLPIIYVSNLYKKNIIINDCLDNYQLPEQISSHFYEILEAYNTSIIYNQTCLRVDDWYLDSRNNTFIISTSRTEYFSSMVTNRALDYKWHNGITVRSILEYGPFMRSLKESRLSNHLGFNGFIETSDSMLMFVKRGSHLSIGKQTYGSSVAASLKSKYGIINNEFTKEGLKNAICMEIRDECKINYPLEDFSLEKNIFAAYRDLVEGGKPQLLFYLHLTNMTKIEVEHNFRSKTKTIKKKRYATNEDGFKFLWLSRNDLQNCVFGVNYMQFNKKKYMMTPSTVASIILLLNHFNELE